MTITAIAHSYLAVSLAIADLRIATASFEGSASVNLANGRSQLWLRILCKNDLVPARLRSTFISCLSVFSNRLRKKEIVFIEKWVLL